MNAKIHALNSTLACAMGLGLLASCTDPFHTAIPAQTGGAAGGPSAGNGGSGGGGTAGVGGGNQTTGGNGGGNADARPAADATPRRGRVDASPTVLAERRCTPLPEPMDEVLGLDCPLTGIAETMPWFPVTPPLGDLSCFPQPHPADECPFYRPTVQQFMRATQPAADGSPLFVTWRTIETAFGAHRNDPMPAVPVIEGGITQAGGRRILIDRNGYPVYYGIHLNPTFVEFIKEFGLDEGVDAVKNADPNLEIPEGAITTKEAWQVVPPGTTPPANYITIAAKVPTFRLMTNGAVVDVVQDDTMLRDVNLQLVGMHVVHTLPGHPEMIWGTFQHQQPDGQLDIAPTTDNKNEPDISAVIVEPMGITYSLFPPMTPKMQASIGRETAAIAPMFNEAMQRFTPAQVTPVYRLYPASKSHTADEDEAIVKLNGNVAMAWTAYKTANPSPNDRRGNYRFIGATWQDVPQLSFALNVVLTNNEALGNIKTNGGDDPLSITGGEDRLSGVALESFTQGVGSFASCFTCHDTRSATKNGIPTAKDTAAPALMEAKKINVSHVFNEVVRLNLR
jgi:hypothetical protein